ncbi:hypothetical protein D9615_010092 [Tricholomella constricta]|uniref:Protein FRA10AC1 n=1 Tax=Tricholomella constricta TaxID=117010 RepID=A0A8H5LX99_9AGAR|nr:hypothetical protein D9615_010092 [Tricholomella constricta]
MALNHYRNASKAPLRTGATEFEILKASHRFLRDEVDTKDLSWDEQLASKYYTTLYREFAVCDLKHYKSGNFALRWRTENEVLSGAGETTCGNARCKHHHPMPDHLPQRTSAPALTTLELPFVYFEHGDKKSALVKVVLCPRCFDKLMWKRRKEKEKGKEKVREESGSELGPGPAPEDPQEGNDEKLRMKIEEPEVELAGIRQEERRRSKHRNSDSRGEEYESRKRRNSRSRSPTPRASHQHNRHGDRSERERRRSS